MVKRVGGGEFSGGFTWFDVVCGGNSSILNSGHANDQVALWTCLHFCRLELEAVTIMLSHSPHIFWQYDEIFYHMAYVTSHSHTYPSLVA